MENTALQLLEVFSHWATFTCGWAPGVWFYCSAPFDSEVMWRVSSSKKSKNQKYFHGFPQHPMPSQFRTSWAGLGASHLSCAVHTRFVLITVIMLKCTVSQDGLLYNVGKVVQYVQYVQCYPIYPTAKIWATATTAHRPCGCTSLSRCRLAVLCYLGQLGCNSCPDHQRQPSSPVWDHVALFCGCHDPLAWLFSCLRQLKRMKPIKTLNQMQWLSHLGKPATLNRAGLKPSHPFSTERKTWRVVSKFQNALISSATKSYQYFHVGSHFSEWEHHSQNVRFVIQSDHSQSWNPY